MNKKHSRVRAAILSLALLLAGGGAHAATSPNLGLADSFGILAGTYTNTAPGTTINGDVGYTTPPVVAPTINGTVYQADGTYAQAGIDQNAALADLNSQPCTHTFAPGAVDLASNVDFPSDTYGPGVYCATGALTIGGDGITLTGPGTYIFRTDAAIDTAAGTEVVLGPGVSECDIWWTATGATTLGANSTFAGTVIDAAGITVGSTVTWNGRALAFGGTVTTDTDTLTVPTCIAAVPAASLTVTKTVVNDDAGTLTAADFPLFVGGQPVTSGVATTTLAPGTYAVTETNDAGYVAGEWGGDCAADGSITLADGEVADCTITNDDVDVVNGGTGNSNRGNGRSRHMGSEPVPNEPEPSPTDAGVATTSPPLAATTSVTVAATTSTPSGSTVPGLPNAGLTPDTSVPFGAASAGVLGCALVAMAIRRRTAVADAI